MRDACTHAQKKEYTGIPNGRITCARIDRAPRRALKYAQIAKASRLGCARGIGGSGAVSASSSEGSRLDRASPAVVSSNNDGAGGRKSVEEQGVRKQDGAIQPGHH
jgi:hypothetical protein